LSNADEHKEPGEPRYRIASCATLVFSCAALVIGWVVGFTGYASRHWRVGLIGTVLWLLGLGGFSLTFPAIL
jgi:hypothetical protein